MNISTFRLIRFSMTLAIAAALSACAGTGLVVQGSSAQALDAICRNPDRYAGEYVAMAGKIINSWESGDVIYIQVLQGSGYNFIVMYPASSFAGHSTGRIMTFFGKVVGQHVGTNAYGGAVRAVLTQGLAVDTDTIRSSVQGYDELRHRMKNGERLVR